MRNLIYLIVRYSAFILFVVFEFLAFFLIVNNNKSQKEIWAHSSNLLSGNVFQKVENIEDYFNLKNQNDSLHNENAKLRETIINYRVNSKNNAFQSFENSDSSRTYTILAVEICSKTLNLRNNFMTLSKGRLSGIDVGMGVISDHGIVGIVRSVSDHFSTVLLITNSQSRISSVIDSKNYPGSLVWNNSNPQILNLTDIPKHANIELGDSVSTSGYSTIFPPGIFIGRIEDFSAAGGGSNYTIDVLLNTELSKLEFVYVVKYLFFEEKAKLIEEENE